MNENIQRDLSQLDTAHWVVSLDTDYIYLEEPDWSEQSGAYHEPPLARMERQKQQASKNQISNHVAAIENKLGILAAWEKHREKEKEKNVKIIGAWETTYIHVHNKAVPDQKVWQLAAEAKKEKQKEILVGSEKSKVVKKVNNKKDPRKMEKQLMQSVQVTTIDKTIDTAKVSRNIHPPCCMSQWGARLIRNTIYLDSGPPATSRAFWHHRASGGKCQEG